MLPTYLNYPQGTPWFNRAYLHGFLGCTPGYDVEYESGLLVVTKAFPPFVSVLPLNDFFWPPSSNNYSLDYVFDQSRCLTIISGFEVAFTWNVVISSPVPLHDWWISLTIPGESVDVSARADIEHLGGYWRPFAD